MRLRIDLSYDGTDFHGWATQPGLRTVQGTLEAALATVLRLPTVTLVCAGRTDTGVHARGQVVHLDLARGGVGRTTRRLLRRLNGILAARRAGASVVAGARRLRRAVLGRCGAATPTGSPTAPRSPTRSPAATCCGGRGRWTSRRSPAASAPLARAARLRGVLQAARGGDHDPHPARPRRGSGTPTGWSWRPCGPTRSATTWSARSSAACWRSARAGARSTWPAEVLAAAVRDPAVAVAAAHGLTLEEVGYPDDGELAAQADRARTMRVVP